MIHSKIHFTSEIDEVTKNIITDYWQYENGAFLNKVSHLGEKYLIKSSEITKLVRANSYWLITLSCDTCQTEIDEKIETKSNLRLNDSIKCSNCKIEEERIRNEKWLARKAKEEEELIRIEIEMAEKFRVAVTEKRWLKLTDHEFKILQKIIENKDLSKIKRNVFDGNFKSNDIIWKVVNKLNALGLIYIKRGLYSNSVLSIEFDSSLASHISQLQVKINSNQLSFSLGKKNDKTTAKQPDYSGTFTLPFDIVLKANVKYLSGGWLLSDGSINLKFTPITEINPPIQTNIEDEPKRIGDIIEEMYNDLE